MLNSAYTQRRIISAFIKTCTKSFVYDHPEEALVQSSVHLLPSLKTLILRGWQKDYAPLD